MTVRHLLLAAWLLTAMAPLGCQVAPPAPAATATTPQQPLRERAAAAENEGRFGEAADLYLQLVAAEPGRIDWVVAAGRCLGRSGRFNDALDLLDRKRREMPGALDVSAMMARTLLLKAERDPGAIAPARLFVDAAEVAGTILQADAAHEDARLILAQALYLQGDQDGAIAQAEEAARRHPHRPGAHILRGRIAMDQFQLLLARRQTEKPEGQADADLVAAIDRHRQAAHAAFLRAAELDPTRAFPHLVLGDLAAQDHKAEAALQHYGAALLLDPEAAAPIPWIEQQLEPVARAAWFAALLARHAQRPGSSAAKAATLRWHQGRAEFAAQQWQAARASFEAVRRDNEAHVNADYYAAIAAFRLDDHDGAEALAARLAASSASGFADIVRDLGVEPRGDVSAMLQYLADRAFAQQRLAHSRDLNHVLACLRDSADAWNNYAFLCRESGKFDESLRGYLLALEREPDSPQLLNDTGVVLHYHLGSPADLAKARDYYERALKAAAAVLADDRADPAERARATQARSDAQQNLAKLPK